MKMINKISDKNLRDDFSSKTPGPIGPAGLLNIGEYNMQLAFIPGVRGL
jgi:hypothetical protein